MKNQIKFKFSPLNLACAMSLLLLYNYLFQLDTFGIVLLVVGLGIIFPSFVKITDKDN